MAAADYDLVAHRLKCMPPTLRHVNVALARPRALGCQYWLPEDDAFDRIALKGVMIEDGKSCGVSAKSGGVHAETHFPSPSNSMVTPLSGR